MAESSVELDKATLLKLERLSGLQFKNQQEIDELREEIRLANQIFEVDTKVQKRIPKLLLLFPGCRTTVQYR
jgi:hypothetical protein